MAGRKTTLCQVAGQRCAGSSSRSGTHNAFAGSEVGTTITSTLGIDSEPPEPASPTFESDRIAETDQAFREDLGVTPRRGRLYQSPPSAVRVGT
jgi:hypothetical protein